MVLLEINLKFGSSIKELREGQNAPALQIMNSRCKTNEDDENGIFKNKHKIWFFYRQSRGKDYVLSLTHIQPQE